MGKYNHFSNRPIWDLGNSNLGEREENILFHRCSLMVEAYISSHVRNVDDAHNLRQEVLLRVLEGLRASYHEKGSFIPWVLAITMNVVRDYYRKKQREPRMIPFNGQFMVVSFREQSRPLDFFRKFELFCRKLGEVFLELSSFERELMWDLFFGKLNFRQAAEKRSMSKSSCFKAYKRLIEKIRKKLKEKGIDSNFFG